jgi:transglutaminase-like putative cysteine protease
VRGGLGRGAHPLVAAQAAWLAASLADARGDRAGAEALRAPLGLVTEGFAIGPFGEGRASFATIYPPEREASGPALAASYPGKGHDVRWRPFAAAVRGGQIFLDGVLRPDEQAVGYVSIFVRSERAQPAALRIGSPGPVRVWLNGAPVFERDVLRRAALDQDAAAMRLGRGWNRILVKTVVADGAWRLFLRVTDPAGRPLPVTIASAQPAAGASRAPAERGRAPRVDTLADLLARRAAAASPKSSASAWLDLARVLAWLAPRDRDERAPAAAFDRALAAQPSFEALLGRADAASDDDERRRLLERAAGLPGVSPGWAAVLQVWLGEVARTGRREASGMARLREALAVDPGGWFAAVALADAELEAGLPLAGLARLRALPEDVRALPRVRRARARLEDAAGQRLLAERELEALAALRLTDVDLHHQLARWARVRGDGATARARLALAAAARPDLPALTVELARLEEGAGDVTGALGTLTALTDRMPDEPTALVALGKLLYRAGRPVEGLARLRTALVLRPQDPDLRRNVERLASADAGDATEADELARRFAADARTLVRPTAPRAADAGDGAIVLLDRRVVRMHPNGLCRTFAQRIVEVRTKRGAEDEKEFAVHYSPGTEEVEIRQARVYRRGAAGAISVREATERSDEDLSEPWYGIYYDNRAEIVRFDGLGPGDVIEVQYVVDDVSAENQLHGYFGDLRYVAEAIPKRRWDYTLIAPASRPIHANEPRLPRLERSVDIEGTERVYRFAATDVAKIEPEPAMPGLAEVAPYLHLSTYADWSEVGAAYWNLIEEQLHADDDVRQAARALVKPGMTAAERVRAVHAFVVRNTRYVGLEFGVHGYKPYKVAQVLARRFGDCKDKASLMLALLREVGVEAELVLVRTRRGGRIDAQPASLAIFDHAIVYVPALARYFDGTAEFAGGAELPAQDQGVPVLRVGPRGAELTETPVSPSGENRVERRWQVDLGPSGDGRVDEQLSVFGQAAPEWREHYQTAGERAERYGRVWTGRFPGARLGAVEMPGIDDREAPVRVHAVVEVPRLGRPAADGAVELPLTGRDTGLVRAYARLSSRRHELVLGYPWQHDEELTFRLPPGWRVTRAPGSRTVEGPFGRFRLDVEVGDDVVRVRSALDVKEVRIAPAEYGQFRAFLGEVDGVLEQALVVAPGAAS